LRGQYAPVYPIRNDKYKRLILTCRTTILSQAKSISDKLLNSNIEISNYEVKLENYSEWDKARILYNHIYLSDLETDQKNIFFQNDFHWKVIKHRFYNPRLIQGITSKMNINELVYSEKYVLSVLSDPKKIWQQPFNVQISQISRLLLLTMYSLGGKYTVTEETLKEAFNGRINYEVSNNNYQRLGSEYNQALKELVGAFVIRTIDKYGVKFSFFNPSIEDFIFDFFKNTPEEYITILESSVFFEQFKYRISTKSIDGEKRVKFYSDKDRKKIYDIFNRKKIDLKGYSHGDSYLSTLTIIIRLFTHEETEERIVEKINNIEASYLSWDDRENLIEILKFVATKDLSSQVINTPHLIKILSKDIPSHYQIRTFVNLISEHPIYYDSISNAKKSNDEYYYDIQQNVNKSWEKFSDEFINDAYGIDRAINNEELENIINERKEEAININAAIGLESPDSIIEYEFDFSSQIEFNNKKNDERDIQIQGYREELSNQTVDINRLFNSDSSEGYPKPPF